MRRRIAVVEDDPEMAGFLKMLLSHNGFEVNLYPTAGRLFDSFAKGLPTLILLDMQLPGMDGREILRVLRSNPETKGLLVIAMSARYNKTSDVVQGLQLGADEYMTKPVNNELLLARIEALLRREESSAAPSGERLEVGGLLVLPDERSAQLGGRPIPMTRLEFDLLVYFLRHANRVLTRSLVLESVWKGDPTMNSRTVDKHVESLRHKLGDAVRIETVVRVGYMMKIQN